jgi:hypothetical protein
LVGTARVTLTSNKGVCCHQALLPRPNPPAQMSMLLLIALANLLVPFDWGFVSQLDTFTTERYSPQINSMQVLAYQTL